jgi:hypothetical protein
VPAESPNRMDDFALACCTRPSRRLARYEDDTEEVPYVASPCPPDRSWWLEALALRNLPIEQQREAVTLIRKQAEDPSLPPTERRPGRPLCRCCSSPTCRPYRSRQCCW